MYSESFEKLWQARRREWHPPSDSKKKAYYQYERIKGITTDQLIYCLQKQYQNREALKKNNEFAPMLPALERWLKHRAWEDDLKEPEKPVTRTHGSHKSWEGRNWTNTLSTEELRERLRQLKEEHRL